MMRISSRLCLIGVLCLMPLLALAQSDTIVSQWEVTRTHLVGIGESNVLDTYLSPEKYKGPELRYISHTLRHHEGKPWLHYLIHEGNVSINDDRSGDGSMIAALYDFRYACHYSWPLMDGRLLLEAGGMLNAGLGVIDNTRNTNNPAQMRLFLHAGASGAANYQFNIRHKPCVLRYEAMVPLLGVMFSPNYGQSYYEIFSRGDYDHNIVPTTPFSAPTLRHSLTIDFPLIGVRWRVGYLGDYQQAAVNDLKQHVYTHALVIGFVKHFKLTHIQP